ncbi:hypothetical protein NCAS_0J00270 [Naumovozyma castellii]|uniref:Ubiquitin thioesterase OTU n=1 Tax=Naumovozyma castellii TaxID=27288 RepID=G0VKH3_NAUCA|nr:hypothetical protein NCAS_0J00270 [Naumovozyma castellii CBS 4309]CCC72007.1 hypothetical protein NCAS_0J00270 [Naumovozyma castellii CBS 4309]
MRLKVSGFPNGGADKVVSIDNGSSLNQLVKHLELSDECNLIAIRFGYPPQRVEIGEVALETSLEDLGLSSGERVNLVLEGGTMAAPVKRKDPVLKPSQTWIETSDGERRILQVHKVPDDNSCLFHAISWCMYKDISLSYQLRELCSRVIVEHPMVYSDAILGRPNREYSEWILKRDSWGGGIELAILSNELQMGIYVLDIDAIKFEKFNDDLYDKFFVILFNGVHYDAIETDDGICVFDKRDEMGDLILKNVLNIARQLKEKCYAFNTQKAKIICNICKEKFVGERDIAKHAEKTGHTDFGQSS